MTTLYEKSEKFPVSKGVREGDPISAKLFTAGLEVLFGKLSQGFKYRGKFELLAYDIVLSSAPEGDVVIITASKVVGPRYDNWQSVLFFFIYFLKRFTVHACAVMTG